MNKTNLAHARPEATLSNPVSFGVEFPNDYFDDLGWSGGACSLKAIMLRAVQRGTCTLSSTTAW
jgi:hypothetical protein